VDLHLIPGADASPDERAAVDELLGPPRASWEGAGRARKPPERMAHGGRLLRERRHLLLPCLHGVQGRVGWISPGALNYICQRLTVPPAEAYSVASFYAMFSLEPRPPLVIHVCDDIACRCNGANDLCEELGERLGPEGTPALGGRVCWKRSPCLGQCERAPAALLQSAGEGAIDRTLAPARTDDLLTWGDGGTAWPGPPVAVPQAGPQGDGTSRLLRRIGRVTPDSLDAYRAAGGYAALRRALDIGPGSVLREVAASKLLGRGGAAFPMGRKWEAVARNPIRPHYVVCNADESEPGTFKDRLLMEEDPFAIIEAMTITGYATGSEQGYLYIRGEYPLALSRLSRAVGLALIHGLLGEEIMGEAFRFDIELRRGAGAYICGEETALFNSIEGFRGEPRNKPPFPTQAGLFGKPTVVNNVETLANVLDIVLDGGPAFAAVGTQESTGTKLFCASGRVNRPGVYEVPFGTTLRELIELAGGTPGGRPVRAVLLGGAAGSFLT
jgi:NADH-quinone oxidoreductase subunit F